MEEKTSVQNGSHTEAPLVSVMIATYNSEKLLRRTLDALVNQDYPAERLEILIVDGGSADQTLAIAREYHCAIFHNPKTEPVHAKLIGFENAKGRYYMTIDHDEVLVNPHSVRNRVQALQRHPECKAALASGYICPPGYAGLSEYISEYGDPFSFFIYRFSKNAALFEKEVKQNFNTVADYPDYFVADFTNGKKAPIFELVCLATIVDREYVRALLGASLDERQLVQLWYIMLEHHVSSMIIAKNDPVWHYSSDSLKKYFPKLKWRVCNNIHFQEKGAVGFNGRQAFQKSVSRRKYLFIPYALTLIAPLAEGILLAIRRHNSAFLLHPILSFYVAIQILYQYCRKLLHLPPAFRSYDGKRKIER